MLRPAYWTIYVQEALIILDNPEGIQNRVLEMDAQATGDERTL